MQDNSFDKAIISDSSCLISLTNINKLDILKKLFKEIIITPEVAAEYKEPLPDWIIKKDVNHKDLTIKIKESGLDIGESSSIALAMETKNSVLILVDDPARKFALKLGLKITGTIGVISQAYDQGHIESYESVCEDLKKVNFRFTPKIQNEALQKIGIDDKEKHLAPKKKSFRR